MEAEMLFFGRGALLPYPTGNQIQNAETVAYANKIQRNTNGCATYAAILLHVAHV